MDLFRFDMRGVRETDVIDSIDPILQHGNNGHIFLFVQILQEHQARKEHVLNSC